jgi:S-adenosylmethionine synthetase
MVIVAGEITSSAHVDIVRTVRGVVNDIGFDSSENGFDGNTCAVLVALEKQSPDISQGVTEGEGQYKEQGAGDQGMMFGYAIDETPELMPMSIHYAHRLVEHMSRLQKSGDPEMSWMRPDSKSQVTVEYRDGRPLRIHTVVISTQHAPSIGYDDIRDRVIGRVIHEVIPQHLIDRETRYFVNPTGRFVIGGPQGDCGLTGRKIIVDTYGGHGAHGGGAFSGKDPSKVDRSAAYMGRYIAKNLVASGAARRCLVELAYAIGVADPVSVMVDTFGTGNYDDETLEACIREVFPLKPAGIIRHLDLLRPIYRQTAKNGHFGRELPDFRWEAVDKGDDIRRFLAR